jgi:beta-glucanase (GH16 family)
LVAITAALCCLPQASRAVWQLTWSDEFDGSAIDTTKWTFENGNNNGWGNSEREYYTSRTNNAFVSGGLLHIVARQESFGGFPYTSARMKTQGLYSHKYGRFEWRAKLPQGVGFWPALWMMGTNIASVNWPACGEIDVLEAQGSWTNQVQGTLHYSDSSNNHLQQTRLYTLPARGDSTTNFHTYAVEWTTNSIKWLVDSNVIQTWTTWSSSTGPYPAPYDRPFFLLMNLAIGGQYLGYPTDSAINAGTVFPGEMQVDYIRVYDDVPVSGPPNPPTSLNSSQGGGTVYLSWDGTGSGALGYKIKRATVPGGPYSQVGTASGNTFADSTVSPCSTYYYVVSGTNSFGESTNSTETSSIVSAFSLAVNSGGTATNQFLTDAYVSGGTQASPVTTTIDTTAVTAPAPQSVYQTERFGNFTYTFSGLNSAATYKVRLHFAETYWTATGQRRFNVLINGTQVLNNFDIITTAGAANKATVQEFTASAPAGQITIQYVTVTDNAKASGIEIQQSLAPTPTAGNNGPVYETGTLSLSASAVPNATYSWSGPNGFSSTAQNPTVANVGTNATGPYLVSATVAGCPSPPASTTVSVLPRPAISLSLSNNMLNLSWPAGVLQAASTPAGPWIDISSGAFSTNINPVLAQQFFRVRVP